MKLKAMFCGAVLVSGLWLNAAEPRGKEEPTSPSRAQGQSKEDVAVEGEKRFQTHCGRCHEPPEDISPSVAGTVLRHMRVRATLTKEDERLILEYIRP